MTTRSVTKEEWDKLLELSNLISEGNQLLSKLVQERETLVSHLMKETGVVDLGPGFYLNGSLERPYAHMDRTTIKSKFVVLSGKNGSIRLFQKESAQDLDPRDTRFGCYWFNETVDVSFCSEYDSRFKLTNISRG